MAEQAKGYAAKFAASMVVSQAMGTVGTWVLQPAATAMVHRITEHIPQQTVFDASALGLLAATAIGTLAEAHYLRKTDGLSYNPWSSLLYPRFNRNAAATIAASTVLGYGHSVVTNPTDLAAIASLFTPDKSLFVSDLAARTVIGFAMCMFGTALVASGSTEYVAGKIQDASARVVRTFPVLGRVRDAMTPGERIPDYPDAVPDGTMTIEDARQRAYDLMATNGPGTGMLR